MTVLETVAGDSRWSQYRVSRWSLGPEQLAAEYGRVHRNDRAKHDLLDVDTAVYTALFVRSTIRWTLRRAPKP